MVPVALSIARTYSSSRSVHQGRLQVVRHRIDEALEFGVGGFELGHETLQLVAGLVQLLLGELARGDLLDDDGEALYDLSVRPPSAGDAGGEPAGATAHLHRVLDLLPPARGHDVLERAGEQFRHRRRQDLVVGLAEKCLGGNVELEAVGGLVVLGEGAVAIEGEDDVTDRSQRRVQLLPAA
jgi:hypothetical protein